MFNVKVLDKLVDLAKAKGNGGITRAEKGYILDMATMLKTEYNALLTDNNRPHTINTLAEELDMVYSRMSKLLNKFVKKGILGKLTTADRTVYVMNPFLARKRKFVSPETSSIFIGSGEKETLDING